SQENANNGVAVSNEVGGILTQIVESVQKLTQLIGEVSTASQEQTKGIEQIGTAVTEMDKLTQSNAANAEESASASEEVAAQAPERGVTVAIPVGAVNGAGSQGATASGSPPQRCPAASDASTALKKPHAAGSPRAGRGSDWSPIPSK